MSVSIMSLISTSPLHGPSVRIGGALAWRKERNFKFQLRSDGLDVGYTTRTGFDLNLDAAAPIDLRGVILPDLVAQIAAAGRVRSGFPFIDLKPQEAEQLARAIATATPNGTEPGIPIIDAYAPHKGVLVPIAFVRTHLTQLQTEKGHPMSHPLRRSVPAAFDLIKQIADDPDKVIAEVLLFEVARAQKSCKRIDHIKGTKPPRAKSLSEEDVDAVVKTYAARVVPRDIAKVEEAQTTALPDGTVAIIPLLGQRNETNVFLLACFIADGEHGSMRVTLEIDEVLPAISRAVLEGLGRRPRDEAAE
jgi:hypothetical protein